MNENETPEFKAQEELNKTEDFISKANAAASRQEAANTKLEELLAKQERLNVEKTLGGKSEAGTGNKEESNADYAKRVMQNDV